MAHPNGSVLRQGYEAFAKRDSDRLFALFADDVAFHVPGRAAISRSHRGKAGIAALFEQLDELTQGTFELELQHVLADGEFGVALVLATAEREGRCYEGRDAHVWRFAGGKLAELWVHPGDQYEADAFFSPAAEKLTEVVKGSDGEDPAAKARRAAAKALGTDPSLKPSAREGEEDNGSGRRPKRGAPGS